jgi:tetratricopeptide (TPR) repeat protein
MTNLASHVKPPPIRDPVRALADELCQALREQQVLDQYTEAVGRAVGEAIQRTLLDGLAQAFRTLADRLPELVGESLRLPPAPPQPSPPALRLLDTPEETPPANRENGPRGRGAVRYEEESAGRRPPETPPVPLGSADLQQDAGPAIDGGAADGQAAREHCRRAKEHAAAGDAAAALADCEQAIRLDPLYAPAYLMRGLLRRRAGQLDRAIEDASQALVLDPNLTAAYLIRGTAYVRQRRFDLAIADLDELLRLEPDNALACNERGLAHANRGDYDRAIADYGSALHLEPRFTLARHNRAVALRLKGDHALAVAELTAVLQVQPTNARVLLDRGLALLALGEHARAAADLDAALALDPTLDEARRHRQEAQRPPSPPPAPSPPTPPARPIAPTLPTPAPPAPPEPTLVQLTCPACGAGARVRWDRLDRLFKCRKCSVVLRVNADGRVTEHTPSTPAPNRSRRRRILCLASVLLVVLLAVWLFQRGRRPPGPPELPPDLQSRSELFARAWLDGDRALLRRLTAPTHDRQLHPWLDRHRPPAPGSGIPSANVQVQSTQTAPHDASVLIRVTASGAKPVVVQQQWVERASTWYFAPVLRPARK